MQVVVFVVFYSYKKKDGDLASAQARIKELESQYNQSEATLTTSLSENAALAAEIADLKNQLIKVSLLTWLCFPFTKCFRPAFTKFFVIFRLNMLMALPKSSWRLRHCCEWIWRTAAKA